MGEVNINTLEKESQRLISLINETNSTLGQKSSVYVDSYTSTLSRMAQNPGVQYQVAQNAKKLAERPETLLVAGVILAVGWVGAKGIDAYSNHKARNKARKALLSMYGELTVKQSLIIEEQNRILLGMMKIQDKSESEFAQLQSRYDKLSELVNRIKKFRDLAEKT